MAVSTSRAQLSRFSDPVIFQPRLLVPLAILFYIAASYFLVYCLHHDEHFQILEFANYKRGNVAASTLPWEFEARLRPTLQPLIAYLFLNLFDFSGLRDPFLQAFIFRLISSFLFIASALKLKNALLPDLQSVVGRQAYHYLSLFLYILPIAGVRFSSENMSACVFAIAFSQLYSWIRSQDKLTFRQSIGLGMLFGLSFLFRYQSAVLLAGLGVWLLIFRLRDFRNYLTMIAGFAIVFFVGILIDYWFYGEWTISAWNYLNFNLLEGKSAGFGISPWHYYLSEIDYGKWLGILNGSLVALVFVFFLIKPKHPVGWVFLAFFVMHSLIPHKETRFLYPILIYVPFMFVATFDFFYIKIKGIQKLLIVFLIALAGINSLAFVATTFSPVDNSIEVYKYVRTLPDRPVKIYFSGASFFYTLNNGDGNITPNFYKDNHKIVAKEFPAGTLPNLSTLSAPADTLTYIVLDREQQRETPPNLSLAFDPQPQIVQLLNYRNWMRHGFNSWKLYRIGTSGIHHEKSSPGKTVK